MNNARLKKFITFREYPNPGKRTRLFGVHGPKGYLDERGQGSIRWYGGFRKYVFYPREGTYFGADGLRFIADFCDQLTHEQYRGRRKVL